MTLPLSFNLAVTPESLARWQIGRDGVQAGTCKDGDAVPLTYLVFLRAQPLIGTSFHEILDRDPSVVEKVIAESVRLKARVVSADEREGGLRQVLNLGHTIGHALEAETRYTQLLHGEAVAWGMIAATQIALSTGKLDRVGAERISAAILGFGRLPRMKFQTTGVLKRLRSDKKTRQGAVHFVLPRQIGKVEIVSVELPRTRLSLVASDHLPLVADVRIG